MQREQGQEGKARMFSRNLAFTPCMNTSLTQATCIHQACRRERVGKEELDGVFSRNLAFAPCMKTSLTKRLVFTKRAERE